MDYQTFFRGFGGSARTKNVSVPGTLGDRQRRVYSLPKESGLPAEFIRLCPWEMEYLFAVARRARRGILEIGRFNGGSTFLLSCANPDVAIYSIDIAPKDDERLRLLFAQHSLGQNVHLIVGDSRDNTHPVGDLDFVFVDGNHSYEGCAADVRAWYDRLSDNGHLVFHDSYLGRHGVQDAIMDLIESRPEITVIASPVIGPSYWDYPAGSLAHLMKRRPTSPRPSPSGRSQVPD